MYSNQILLKGSHASKVVDECPDTKMVLMNGQVKSHLLVLATNPFLHQLIKSSWVPGEISTFLMPQHSVMDMLLEFSLPLEIYTNGKESFDFKFTAKDIPEDVDFFGDNADNININLDETVTSDDPSSFVINEEIDVERALTRVEIDQANVTSVLMQQQTQAF